MSLLKALDSSNVAQHLKVNASGALECSVNEIELTATDIHVAVDGLEGLQADTITKLNGGLPSALSSDNLKVSLKETITVPISGSVTATVSGVSTEAKQDSIISTLGDTNNKIDSMRGSNSISDLASKLNGGLPSALSSDNLKVSIQEGQITGFSTSSLQTTANNTLSSIDGKIILPSALDSGKLKVVDSAVVDVGNKIDAMRASDTLTTLKSVLDTIDSDTNDIKTSIQSLDNAVDGNYLNVNQNVAGADVATDSGNKGVTVPRVCIATDDIPIALVNTKLQAGNDLLATIDSDTNDIKTSIQSLDNAVDGNYLNVNQNVAGVDVAVDSGNKGTTVPRVCIATDDIPVALVNTKLQAGNDLLTTIDADTNDIKTSLQSIDNAVDGNYLNVNQNVAGVDVAVDSGNKGVTVPRVCIATDDIPVALVNTKLQAGNDLLATIDADTNDIKTSIQSLDNAVDGNYLNVNQNIAGTDVDSNSGNKSAASQRVVIADDDTNLSAIKTAVELLDDCIGTDNSTGPAKCISIGGTNPLGGNIQEIAVDSSGHLSVDILSSAIPSGASTELSLAVVKTKATLATSSELKTLLSGVTINSGAQSSQFDSENFDKVRFFGETTASVGTDIILMGAATDGGQAYVLGENLRSETIGGVHYVYGPLVENLPKYIRILNKSGSTNYVFTKLFMQLSGGRLAV